MNDMNVFPILIAVADNLSLTQSAKALNMTKSAISKAIQGVEEKLGVRLFHRTTRSISLTEEGIVYIGYIRESYKLATIAQEAVSQFSDKAKGIIKISAPMSFGTLHIAKIMPLFMQKYPELEVQLLFDDNVTDLVAQGYDIAIRIGELPDSSLIARQLSPCYSQLYASSDYLDKYGVPKQISELKNHNCLSYSLYQAGMEWVFYQKGKKHSHIPKGNYRVNNSEALLQAVLQGVGIALLPHFITQIHLSTTDKKLIPILTQFDLPEHFIYAVYPDKKNLPRKTILFVDFLKTHFGVNSDYQRNIERKRS
ncbi:LysR family transcriptional regulator [Proteus vulgaris]|uniref:LysR family transcriptional regulator n=1 Tax=Proteus vulgaris TaxID=585 RepID=A0A6G6SHP4_PROVU|nr:LysR family transcriptional regulator [Proteus vulgaris]QIF94072.1 LysR family transcriptional regulator [Proteus vulgaris]WIF74032.1 LysR family transcriptional regulator [Proteus vulgaris]